MLRKAAIFPDMTEHLSLATPPVWPQTPFPRRRGAVVIERILLITSPLLILGFVKHHLYFCLFFFLLCILNMGVSEKMEQKKIFSVLQNTANNVKSRS